jgi:hypothetical protein
MTNNNENEIMKKSKGSITQFTFEGFEIAKKQELIDDQGLIYSFMLGKGRDSYGRYYHDLIAVDDEEMEKCHDKIQWLFPLHEPSGFAQKCPIIVENCYLLHDNSCQENIRLATYRMINFFDFKSRYVLPWCNPRNHNLLRITRIIRSLRLFNQQDLAFEFYCMAKNRVEREIDSNREFCFRNPEVIDKSNFNESMTKTLEYWTKAMFDPKYKTLK